VLTWDKLTGKHHFTALAGTEAIEAKSDGLNATSAYLDDAIKVVRIAGSEQSNLEQGLSSYSLLSYFGNFSYNYDQKYYLEGNIRRDGSSRFGENSKWGVFPSFSVAWRLSKELFFPKNLADDLKLRLSYGEVGNDKIGNFSYIAPIGTVLYSMSNTNGSFETGAAINSLANPDLKWEISKQFNIGIDMLFLDNKLNIVADYFETKVEDMLLGLSIPAITGITNPRSINNASVIANAGSLKNKGFELEVSYRSAVGNFKYGVNANLTTFNNEVTDIGNNEQLWGSVNIKNGGPVSRTVVGGPLGEFYGHVAEGIFQTQAEVDAANALDGNPSTPYQQTGTAPGDFKFRDLNGDHVINDEDRTRIGSPIPDFTYGFGIELGYKDFDFSALFTGVQGRDIYNAVRSELEASGGINANRSKTVLNAWNGEGTSNTIPRSYNSDPNFNGRISSMYVDDGSYLRLRNVRLAYNLPKQFTSRLSVSNAQIYITGSNLLTFTKYKGYDPEVGNSNGNNLSSGVELEIYPQAQTFHIGARITF
jgi:TonB-linked SusC/RagA family outer membrane protein